MKRARVLTFDERITELKSSVSDAKTIDIIDSIITDYADTYTHEQLYGLCYECANEPYVPHAQIPEYLYTKSSIDKAIPPDVWTKHNGTNIYNVSDIQTPDAIFNSVLPPNNNYVLMYHVTDWRSALLIQEQVNPTLGRECLDFGHSPGFYLTDKLYVANEYIQKLCKHKGCEVALLVFSVPKWTTTNVKPSRNMIFERTSKEWRDLIKYSRKCKDYRPNTDIESLDYIYGPMCSNPEPVKVGEEPIAHRLRKTQLVVRNNGPNLLKHRGTVFINKQALQEMLEERKIHGGYDADNDDYSRPCSLSKKEVQQYFRKQGWFCNQKAMDLSCYSADWTDMHIFRQSRKALFEKSKKDTFEQKLLDTNIMKKTLKKIMKIIHNDDKLMKMLKDPKEHFHLFVHMMDIVC